MALEAKLWDFSCPENVIHQFPYFNKQVNKQAGTWKKPQKNTVDHFTTPCHSMALEHRTVFKKGVKAFCGIYLRLCIA